MAVWCNVDRTDENIHSRFSFSNIVQPRIYQLLSFHVNIYYSIKNSKMIMSDLKTSNAHSVLYV